MEPFFGTPIRVLSSSDEAAATAWLLESPPEGATITFLPESEGALVALRVTGRLRDVDYETLKAELTRRLLESGKLRMLVIMDEEFRGCRTEQMPMSLSFISDRKRISSRIDLPRREISQQTTESNFFRYASLIREFSAGRLSLDNVPDNPSSAYSLVISQSILEQ